MNSVLISSGLLINLVFLFFMWRKYILPRKIEKDNYKLAKTLKLKVVDLEKEVARQSYVINDYKGKLEFKSDSGKSEISQFVPDKNPDDIKGILSDKQMLEKEKEAFKQKNLKLWEQSLAVYKEKEKIDSIRKYIETQHNHLTQSINYALLIQEALLPEEELLKQLFPDYFILYRPRNIVSGDFYWVRKIENRTIFVASDCTGHGVPGAFMSLLGISFLNEITSNDKHLTAAQILEEMRIRVKSSFQQDDENRTVRDGMEMVVCIVDEDTQMLEFSGAVNGIFIAKNNGELIELKGTRSPISYYIKEKPFENHNIQLEVNDSILMYSDGYFDQMKDGNKRKIKRSQFRTIVNDCLEKGFAISDYKKALELFLDDWQGGGEQIDDILVFGVTCFKSG